VGLPPSPPSAQPPPTPATSVHVTNITAHQLPAASGTRSAHPGSRSTRNGKGPLNLLFLVDLPGRKLVWDAELSFTSARENFHYRYVRRVSENGALLREKTKTRTIPGDYQ
jgi:hypothetical protein